MINLGRFNVLIGLALAIAIFVRMLFEPVTDRAVFVMFFLIIDVIDDPFQIFCSEGHDHIATLPFESFRLNFVVDVVRTRTPLASRPNLKREYSAAS